MKSGSLPTYSHQAQSQPILPSERSWFFRNGMADHQVIRDRSRLSQLPPRLSGSALAVASPRTASPRDSMPPLRALQQPHQPPPFFSRGPAAMGYIPQQSLRYSRQLHLQEPIVPLRDEFSAVSNIHHADRSMAWQGHAQPRPYSVPSQPMQSSRTNMEHSAQTIPRPTSVAHTGTRRLYDLSHPASKPQLEQDDENFGLSSNKRGFPDDLGWEDEPLPPKRTLPFPISKQAKAPTMRSDKQFETINTGSSAPNVNLTAVPHVNQCTPAETSKEGRPSASQLQSSDMHPNKREMTLLTCSNDVSANSGKAPKRATRIKLVSRSTTNGSKDSVAQEYIPLTPNSTQADEIRSQEFEPSQMSQGKVRGDSISGYLDPMISVTEGIATPTDSSQAQEWLQQSEAEKISIVPSFIPEDPHTSLINRSISSQHDRNSELQISQQPPLTTPSSTWKNPSRTHPNIPAPPCHAPKRSASQATTVSTASTEPPCTGKDKDSPPQANDIFNPMSIIDEKMVLEHNVSDIVTARLREGNGTAASLDAFHAEILIKMAVRDGDEDVFGAVCRMLSS
ncbi:hypothetical protein F5B17DRAFT_385263 [Nemania serpens]|nr:hypothetical protein F5B17DRAFT_385263 [Nemania serpens]